VLNQIEKEALLIAVDVYQRKTGQPLFNKEILKRPELSLENKDILIKAIEEVLTKRDKLINRPVLKRLKASLSKTFVGGKDSIEKGATFIGMLLGYRSWGFLEEEDQIHLTAMFNHFQTKKSQENIWVPGLNKASCHGNLNQVAQVFPHLNHECGFNAFFDPGDAAEFSNGFRSLGVKPDKFIFGSVAGFGQMQIHQDGWRSEYALPLALLMPKKLTRPGQGRIIKEASKRYGLPLFSSQQELAAYSLTKASEVDKNLKPRR